MKKEWKQYISIIKQAVKPALGCTEPISAAYASATAAQLLGKKPDSLEVHVSDNLYKNSMGVFVPGTGKIGLPIAAAVGAIGGNPDAGLEVLADITQEMVEHAQQMIDAGKIKITRVKSDSYIYCNVIASAGNNKATVTIRGGHTNIVETTLNNVVIFKAPQQSNQETASICDGVEISIQKIYDFALEANIEDIEFILEAATLNKSLSEEGLKRPYGLEIGRMLQENGKTNLLCDDLMTQVQMHTSAASDARMGGATLPAMTNFGSGNQGIAATMPLVVAAEHFHCTNEHLARALILSHLGAVYIKSHYPPLSAFCGNTVTSAATSMALVYLAGGSFEQSCYAIQNVISDSSGMICDGAKASCAMKICTSSNAAVRSFMMALRNSVVCDQGIVAKDVEQTIKNIGEMVCKGMSITDSTIIEIMSS